MNDPAPHYSARSALIDTENAFKIGPFIVRVEGEGKRVIRCNLGEPDFRVPEHVREEVKRALDAGLTGYCDPQGIQPLREAIADDVSAMRGIQVTPDRVVVFPGGKPPIGLAQQTYVDPGDDVIYPSPGFPIYESFTGYVGARPVPLHLQEENGFALTGEDLDSLITGRTRLIYINSPANPTGGVVTREQLEAVAEVILRRAPAGVRIFSDEIYERIVFDGERHASIASIPEMEERTIIVSGVSKSYAWTGGRIGWAVFPTSKEAGVFRNLNVNYTSCVPAYNQMGAVAALRSPSSAPAVAEMVAAFQQRRDLVVARLNEIPGVTCATPKGAFYVFPNVGGVCERIGAVEAWEEMEPDLRGRSSPSTLLQLFLLGRYGVATLDRKSFGRIGSEGKHFLRLSVATCVDDLREATERIAAAADDSQGFRDFIARDPMVTAYHR